MIVSGRVLVGESERVNESKLVLVNESVSERVNCRVTVSEQSSVRKKPRQAQIEVSSSGQ